MEKASALKEEGTQEFLAGNHSEAAKLYKRAANLFVSTSFQDCCCPDCKQQRLGQLQDAEADIYVKCWGNAAMCHVKEKSWPDVIDCCNEVLDYFPDEAKTNIKVLYRRGLAKMHTGVMQDAKADLIICYEIDNENKDVRRAIKELKPKIAEDKKKEKTQLEVCLAR